MARLPTPVRQCPIEIGTSTRVVHIKQDDLTSDRYGGNKVRKLEYLLARTKSRGRRRVATFGAVGSNHALATAVFACANDIQPVCLLSHQTRTPLAAATLGIHLSIGTEIVEYGGAYAERIAILRRHLHDRDTDMIPLGGSSWVGTVGFVAAGIELAMQIDDGLLPVPERIYLASGTLGTAAGLALGLTLAGLDTEVHAVRVSHRSIANDEVLWRLMRKTVTMLARLDPAFPADLAERARITLRHGYFGPGYAHSNPPTDKAIALAKEEMGLELEPTYTGKAMAAMLDDLRAGDATGETLFWNTYNSARLPASAERPEDTCGLPDAFLGYFI